MHARRTKQVPQSKAALDARQVMRSEKSDVASQNGKPKYRQALKRVVDREQRSLVDDATLRTDANIMHR